MKKYCNMCKSKKDQSQFSESHGKHYKRCKSCQSILSKKHYAENKEKYLKTKNKTKQRNREYIYSILKRKECIDCGEKDVVVLEFDHIDPSEKTAGISAAIQNSWSIKKIDKEISKCEVRCCNCHRRKTAKERGYYSLMT